MPDISGIVWWMLTGVFASGFGTIAFLLAHWFRRIENTLQMIWGEIKESRAVESDLIGQIAEIRATCRERHRLERSEF